jgi:hypothetical protein
MVAITAIEIRNQITLEIGDIDPLTSDPPALPVDGLIYQRIDFLWRRYASKDAIAPGLRELYTKRAAIRMILAVMVQRRFDVSDVLTGFGMKANQIWEHYQEMHACVKAEIEATEAKFAVSVTPAGGRLKTRAPVTPRHRPDANAPRYGGDPYWRRGPGAARR